MKTKILFLALIFTNVNLLISSGHQTSPYKAQQELKGVSQNLVKLIVLCNLSLDETRQRLNQENPKDTFEKRKRLKPEYVNNNYVNKSFQKSRVIQRLFSTK